MSFKEMKEKERIAEQASIGPGSFDGHLKPFGSGMSKVDFGKKYEWKPDSNPPLGLYNTTSAEKHTKDRKYETFISVSNGKKRPGDAPIDPG